jgi:hypothetical protein
MTHLAMHLNWHGGHEDCLRGIPCFLICAWACVCVCVWLVKHAPTLICPVLEVGVVSVILGLGPFPTSQSTGDRMRPTLCCQLNSMVDLVGVAGAWGLG